MNSCREQMKEKRNGEDWRNEAEKQQIRWMFQMCSKNKPQIKEFLLVMLLDLIVGVTLSWALSYNITRNWEVVKSFVLFFWSYFRLLSWWLFCYLLQFCLHILFMGLLAQLFDVSLSCPCFLKQHNNWFFFVCFFLLFFGSKGLNQPTDNGSTLTKSTCLHYSFDVG